MTDDVRLAEIRAREELATKGPWEVWNGCSWWRIGREGYQSDRPVIEPCNDRSDGHPNLSGPNLRDDLEFIAKARDDIRFLLTQLDQRDTAIDGAIIYRKAVEKMIAGRDAEIARLQAKIRRLRQPSVRLTAFEQKP